MAVTVAECIAQAERYLRLADATEGLESKLAYAAMARAYQYQAVVLMQADRG